MEIVSTFDGFSQRSSVNFFELVQHGYQWEKAVHDYLFEGHDLLFNSISTDHTE